MAETRTLKLFIDGHYVDTKEHFDDINPATGERIAAVSQATQFDVDHAVTAARKALRGPWGRLPLQERQDALRAIADGITKRFADFVEAEMLDTGKPIGVAGTLDIPRAAANFQIFADIVRGLSSEFFEMATDDGNGALNYAIRRPLGVVGVVCPWNLPLLLMTWKVAPALAAGNTVVVKPSEETPATATLLGEVMNQAGIPKGVYNVIHGFGPDSAGEWLTRHPSIDGITFTGESRTGQSIMKAAADGVKRISFELGGKNAAIVFEDCDFDAAVAGTARSVFTNSGQVCLCSERVYVARPIFDRFVGALHQAAQKYIPGDPFNEKTTLGPLISKQHFDKVTSYFELARQEGARILIGGGVPMLPPPFSSGFYVQPTMWSGLPENARCVREEVFGPVCHLAPFDAEDEVIAMANDSDYGLCAAVWTRDLSRAHRVARQLQVGLVWVNTWYLRDLRTPFGGMKLSGIGREGGTHSFDFYTELRNVCIKL